MASIHRGKTEVMIYRSTGGKITQKGAENTEKTYDLNAEQLYDWRYQLGQFAPQNQEQQTPPVQQWAND